MEETISSPPARAASIRPLGYVHLDDVLELQREVAASLPEELFECDDAAFYSSLFDGGGRVLGIFHGEILSGCSVISWPESGSPLNLGRDLGLDVEKRSLVVNLEAAYVLPACQGRGLARLLSGMQLDFAAKTGKRYALSTASPSNFFSLRNLFSLGFTIRKISGKYGGKIRCIMFRDLSAHREFGSCDSGLEKQWISSYDLAAQKDVLERGWEGIGARGTKESFEILYVI